MGLSVYLTTAAVMAVPILNTSDQSLPECPMWVVCRDGLGSDYFRDYVDRYWIEESQEIPEQVLCRCGTVIIDVNMNLTSTTTINVS